MFLFRLRIVEDSNSAAQAQACPPSSCPESDLKPASSPTEKIIIDTGAKARAAEAQLEAVGKGGMVEIDVADVNRRRKETLGGNYIAGEWPWRAACEILGLELFR